MLVKIKRLTSPDVEYNGEIYSKEENDRMIKLADYLLKHNKLYLINIYGGFSHVRYCKNMASYSTKIQPYWN